MESVPETRWTKSGDINVAYQVVGDGPIDLVCVPGFIGHVELVWEHPSSPACTSVSRRSAV